MLSHQPSTMDQQRRQSRPTGPRLAMFEDTGMPQRPSTVPMRQNASFAQLNMGPQDGCMAGYTNTGPNQQHYLQVAHQQRQAFPGQTHPSLSVPMTAEQYRTFQHRKLDAELDSAFQGNQQRSQAGVSASAFQGGLGISGFMPDTAVGMPGYGYLNPKAITSPKRKPMPLTPPMQTTNFFPSTPEQTPFCRVIDFSPIRAPLELPKQSTNSRRESEVQQGPSGLQIIVTEPARDGSASSSDVKIKMEQPTTAGPFPSPPNTAPIPSGRTFDASFIPGPPLHSMPALRLGGPTNATPFDLFNELVDMSASTSPQMSSPEQSPMQVCSEFPPQQMNLTNYPVMDLSAGFQFFDAGAASNFGPWDARTSTSPRSNSLDMDSVMEDTGVSMEEVQAYIEEPDVNRGGKWRCLFPECDKLFGRKENIRSHVQTHLGDRQFKCLHCQKCFVRQHDLKRHAKIHSGVKPYPCSCGNTFARHDALTRHRQRGICDGGLPGVVKKMVKRGRPRKERLNTEERADKANRTRAATANKAYASSESGDSEEDSLPSTHNSPSQPSRHNSPLIYDSLDLSPLQQENLATFDQPTTTSASSHMFPQTSFSPSVFSTTPPPVSPYSTGDKPSSRKSSTITATATASPHNNNILSFEEDSGIDADVKDMALFGLRDNILDQTPELTHSSAPSTRTGDVDFNHAFNSSQFGQSITWTDQSNALFDDPLLDGISQDPTWDNDFLNFDNTDNKSFSLFNDQTVFGADLNGATSSN